MKNIEHRIETLERRCRRQQLLIGGIALTLAGAVGLGMSQDKPTDLVVNSLTILDTKGTPRMEMGVDKDGSGLSFNDADGNMRIALGCGPNGDAGIAVFDSKAVPRIAMGTDRSDEAGLVLSNAEFIEGGQQDHPDHPKGDHPDHPKGDHPDHPSGDHPSGDHPG
ncbi:MAG: hypothetical protein QGH76_06520 [Phycisphaerales bacterium]|jgi:hypothetical protein|nr:hypothetical protein [Phycisphaerales bacterium]